MQDQLYHEEFKEWIIEQQLRINELTFSIETSRKIMESNEKQLSLMKQKTNIAINEHNEWTERSGFPKIDLL